MIQRIIPEGMRPETAPTPEMASTETARFENTDVDKCPVCKEPMRRSLANDVPVMMCTSHSIVMPTKD